MKVRVNNIFRILFGFIAIAVFTACEFKETIVFDENGGGKVATSFFGEQLGEIIESLKEDSSGIEYGEFSMQEFIEQNKTAIDSLSPKQQKEIYDLADSQITMQNKEGDLHISVAMDFDSIEEINKKIEDSRRTIGYWLNESPFPSEKDQDANENSLLEDQLDIKYSWKNNVFERKAYIKDSDAYAEALEKMKDGLMFGGALEYVLEYTFPYEIETVVPRTATLSVDRKTVFLRSNLPKILKNPNELDLKITFKK